MTRYSKTMMESLAEVREGFSPKQIKMAIGIANDPRYKGGNYSGAVKTIEKIKKGLSNHKQVAAVLKRLNTDFDPEIKGDDEEMTEASARRDAMRHGAGGRRGIDPADRDDVKATDKDQELAKKNMVMQLRKSKDTKGNFSIEFQDGKKQKVDPKFVDLLLKAHDMIQKPRDKEQFVQMISKSYRDMLKTAKMVSKQLRMGEEIIIEAKEEYVCEDCGCEQGNADPNCDCPNDSTDLQASYWMKKEEFEIDEMKMDDPKLNKIFDKLKKGQTIKLKTSSTISKGKDFVDYIVKSKNTVNKGKVEKVTLVTKGNEKSVKKFLYKRDGKVTFAIGDMGASIDDIKEELDEGRMKDLHGYIEKGMSAKEIAKKMKLYVKTIQALMDETDLDEAVKTTHVVVDTANGDKVVATASDEKGAQQSINSSERPPMSIKNKKTLKIVKLKKPASDKATEKMIGYPLKEEVISEEEEPQKSDGAKAVDQGREDKKKTRIAQLQLQIAKAQETINQLNAQEK